MLMALNSWLYGQHKLDSVGYQKYFKNYFKRDMKLESRQRCEKWVWETLGGMRVNMVSIHFIKLIKILYYEKQLA